MDIFADWLRGGTHFGWASTTAANAGAEVEIFSRRCGTPGAPALVCVHGFPTSSIDYRALAGELGAEFDIFTLDFPGYGLSGKPPWPFCYSLYDDARLLVQAITQVWKLGEYRMITHDRGTSVGMIALGMLADQDTGTLPADVFMTNANIFLPLANLTAFQVAHNDGIAVLPDTVKYLHERAAGESGWLERLSRIDVDTTLIWGLHDSVAPLRVANHVWQAYMKDKPGRNRYWVVPGADHYVQCDAPAEVAQIIRLTIQETAIALQTIGDRPDGSVLVDQSGGDGQ